MGRPNPHFDPTIKCNEKCQASQRHICECRCGGRNHGDGRLWTRRQYEKARQEALQSCAHCGGPNDPGLYEAKFCSTDCDRAALAESRERLNARRVAQGLEPIAFPD